jgi:hypothetical protein
MADKVTSDDAFKSAMTLEKIVPKALEGQSAGMSLVGIMLDGAAKTPQAWNDVSKQLAHDMPVAGLQSFTVNNDDKGNLKSIDFNNGNAKLSCAQDGIGFNCAFSSAEKHKF